MNRPKEPLMEQLQFLEEAIIKLGRERKTVLSQRHTFELLDEMKQRIETALKLAEGKQP